MIDSLQNCLQINDEFSRQNRVSAANGKHRFGSATKSQQGNQTLNNRKEFPAHSFCLIVFVNMQLERQIQNKKEEYESLKRSISDLAREEQLYRETLKLIAHESQKYKILLAKSNQLVQS